MHEYHRTGSWKTSVHALCVSLALALVSCGPSAMTTLGLVVHDDDGVGSAAYCEAVADWDAEWTAFENAVLDLVNQQRAAGADCGSGGSFVPANPLTMNPALRCAARNHSLDMAARDYFNHYSPEGEGPGERFNLAEYQGSTWGENIAWGYASPDAVVAGWMSSSGHCANIMNANFTEMGVGYYEGSIWTQTFGRP